MASYTRVVCICHPGDPARATLTRLGPCLLYFSHQETYGVHLGFPNVSAKNLINEHEQLRQGPSSHTRTGEFGSACSGYCGARDTFTSANSKVRVKNCAIPGMSQAPRLKAPGTSAPATPAMTGAASSERHTEPDAVATVSRDCDESRLILGA